MSKHQSTSLDEYIETLARVAPDTYTITVVDSRKYLRVIKKSELNDIFALIQQANKPLE